MFASSRSPGPSIKHVYITGRRQALLDEISAKYPNVSGVYFDPSDLAAIPEFCRRAVEDLGVDVVLVNAGMQRGIDFTAVSKPLIPHFEQLSSI